MSFIINPYQVQPSSSCVPVTGTNTNYGTGTIGYSNLPFYGLYDYSEAASLYPQSLIGTAKQVTGIGTYMASYTTPYTFSNVEIWMAHTTLNEFPVGTSVGYSTVGLTNLTQCYSGPFVISSNNTWKSVTFNVNNFCYDGVSNVVVIFKNYDGSWTSGYGTGRGTSQTGNPAGQVYRTVTIEQDTTYPANGSVMTRAGRYTNIRLQY
jgi:hypothetical protein